MNKRTRVLTQRTAPYAYSLIAQLTAHLDFTEGWKVTAEETVKACLRACAEKASLNAVTNGWETPKGKTISQSSFENRVDEAASIPRSELEARFQSIYDHQLREAIARYQTRRPKPLKPDDFIAAIDFHVQEVTLSSNSPLNPFVKGSVKTDKYGNKKKCNVLVYVTCALAEPFRLTLSTHLVTKLDDTWGLVVAMVAHLRDTFGIRRFLMDREFFCVELISWFESQQDEDLVRYLMPTPATKNGIGPVLKKGEDMLSQFEGTHLEFLIKRKYTIKSGTGRTIETKLNIIIRKTYLQHLKDQHFGVRSRDKRMDRFFKDPKLIAFATNIDEPLTYKLIDQAYGRRWQVEIDYREVERFMPPTSSRKATTRIFWFNLACLMENVLEIIKMEADLNWYDFRLVIREISEQSDREAREMISADQQRRDNLHSIHQLAKKISGEQDGLGRRVKASGSTRARYEKCQHSAGMGCKMRTGK